MAAGLAGVSYLLYREDHGWLGDSLGLPISERIQEPDWATARSDLDSVAWIVNEDGYISVRTSSLRFHIDLSTQSNPSLRPSIRHPHLLGNLCQSNRGMKRDIGSHLSTLVLYSWSEQGRERWW